MKPLFEFLAKLDLVKGAGISLGLSLFAYLFLFDDLGRFDALEADLNTQISEQGAVLQKAIDSQARTGIQFAVQCCL